MPEENKKENFTFSDKIKDSKQANAKSFANRVSSKIGRDGKPKQTIFERTKRDAPFLIAALVALLLLPFLYRYSGSVNEEAIVAPSSADTVFQPDRNAYAVNIENPEEEIAQLSARDPLDLIKRWGSENEEENYAASDSSAYDYNEDLYRQRDAYLESASASAKKSAVDTNVDIEENTTNIYKKRAVAGTRHGFKRAATKINPMTSARRPGIDGHKLAIGNWGGAVKNAAQKVKGETPKNSPKPVSLQPLQSIGKPSRSAFGNPAAAMRQAKDALGKHDAQRAILDAQVKPVEPGSFGGLTFGDNKFGGGSGNLERKFNYNPQTPWWWDLMKTRSQAVWQHKMDRKWQWEGWLDKLAQNILGGLINCLVTGDDGGDVDGFLGKAAGAGKDPKCNGQKEADFKIRYADKIDAAIKAGNTYSFESFCKSIVKSKEVPDPWQDGTKATYGMNFFQTRLACLGIGVGGGKYKGEDNEVTCDCNESELYGRFRINAYGVVKDWANKGNVYHWVVVRNRPISVGGRTFYLCDEHSDNLSFGEEVAAVGTRADKPKDLKNPDNSTTLAVERGRYKKGEEKSFNPTDDPRKEGCVIYQAQGDTFVENSMITGIKETLEELLVKQDVCPEGKCDEQVLNAYNQLDFMFIEGGVLKDKLGNGGKGKGHLLPGPMLYYRFVRSYLNRLNIRLNGQTDNIMHDNPLRGEGEVRICGARCDYSPEISVYCDENSVPPTLHVTVHKKEIQVGASQVSAVFTNEASSFNGTVELVSSASSMDFTANPIITTEQEEFKDGTVKWTVAYEVNGVRKEKVAICGAGVETEHVPAQNSLTTSRTVQTERPVTTCEEDIGQQKTLVGVDQDKQTALNFYKGVFSDTQKTADTLTVGDLVNAILDPTCPTEIPADVVCILGKTIGANSKDPTAGDAGCGYFDNIFGSFLAFMGLDAASFPTAKTWDPCEEDTAIDNRRFLPDCKGQEISLYWWGSYVDDNYAGEGTYFDATRNRSFMTSDGKNPWEGFPLKGLIKGQPFSSDNRLAAPDKAEADALIGGRGRNEKKTTENYYRIRFHNTYRGLEDATEPCDYGDKKLAREDVRKYIYALCENGTQIKPIGWLSCSEYNRRFEQKRQAAKTRTSARSNRSGNKRRSSYSGKKRTSNTQARNKSKGTSKVNKNKNRPSGASSSTGRSGNAACVVTAGKSQPGCP